MNKTETSVAASAPAGLQIVRHSTWFPIQGTYQDVLKGLAEDPEVKPHIDLRVRDNYK